MRNKPQSIHNPAVQLAVGLSLGTYSIPQSKPMRLYHRHNTRAPSDLAAAMFIVHYNSPEGVTVKQTGRQQVKCGKGKTSQ